MNYLIDSVIVIDHFNGISAATDFLADHVSVSAISVITRAEVLAGFNEDETSLAKQLLDAFPVLPLTTAIADVAARLRRTQRWKLPDAIQAAIAKHHELTLVTRNTRDFQSNELIDVLVPYRVG